MTETSFPTSDVIQKQDQFLRLFESWAESRAKVSPGERPMGAETADIYREMWAAFATFCIERDLHYDRLRADDLSTFFQYRQKARVHTGLRERELNARYARRFLTLIDRVLKHAAQEHGCQPNHAAAELLEETGYKHAEAVERDPLPEYLRPGQAEQLIRFCGDCQKKMMEQGMVWKELRDIAAIALMLGAGLAPGDVRSLRTDGVIRQRDENTANTKDSDRPWKLSVPGNGNSPARETPIAPWAADLLKVWLEERQRQRLAGDYVFPSTASGKQWSQSRCFESCKAALEKAGIGEAPGGLFRLRHTFVLRQLADGHAETDIARWLGLLDITGMNRYKRIVTNEVTLR
jgi:integrase